MATVTRYIDTASSGGDGTTQNHSGGTAAYASMSAWEAAEQTNLVTDGDVHVVNCAGGADSTVLTIAGWTCGVSNTLTIQGDPSAPDSDGVNTTGIFDANYYHLQSNNSATDQIVHILADYCTIQDIQFLNDNTSGSANERCAFVQASNSGVRRVICQVTATVSGAIGVYLYSCSDPFVEASVINFTQSNSGGSGVVSDTVTGGLVQNCTITGVAHKGIFGAAVNTSCDFVNCAIFDCANDVIDLGSGISLDYCATDDGDGTNSVDISPGAVEADDWRFAFEDYVNDDFNIKDTNSRLDNAGTATGLPSSDVTGTSFTTNDIGAFASAANSPDYSPRTYHHSKHNLAA